MSNPAAPSEPVAAPPSSSSSSSVHPPPKPYLSSPSPSPSPLRPSPSPLLSLRNPSSPSPAPHPPPPPPQLYPVAVAVAVAAASHHRALGGVGFPPKPSPRALPPPPPPDQSVTVANPAGYIPNASPTAVMNLPAAQARPFLHGVPDHAAAAAVAMRPPPMQAQQLLPPLAIARPVAAAGGGGGGSGVVSLAVPPKGVPAAAHSKVRILDTESPSLYSLCRDWVRNGVPHESQPNIGNSMPLPKPSPASMIDASILRDDENGDKDGESNHLGSAKELSTRDLLNEHIKRGKKIRARLSKVRRLRIERYKERLTILLPPNLETGRHETA